MQDTKKSSVVATVLKTGSAGSSEQESTHKKETPKFPAKQHQSSSQSVNPSKLLKQVDPSDLLKPVDPSMLLKPEGPSQLLKSEDPSQHEHDEHDIDISVKIVDEKITLIGVSSTEPGEDIAQVEEEVNISYQPNM